MDGTVSRHRMINPSGMPPPVGFSHGVLAAEGRIVHIAGQTGHHSDLSIDPDLVAQFRLACAAVARVIEEAGGSASDLVSLVIYTTDVTGYRSRLDEIGESYRRVFGKHFPAMALIGVAELFDPAALVELVGTAVVPIP
jgi:enamine deaminase RidA (YjgF/YER057c/UK114 family)